MRMPVRRLSVFLLFMLGFGFSPFRMLHAEYRVGEGDILEITIFEEQELHRLVRVTADGLMTFPLVGKLKVAGLTAMEIADALTERLATDYLVNPQVSVFIKEYASHQVQVLGNVRNPGLFNLTGNAQVTDMLARAGGLTEKAGKTLVLVHEAEAGTDFRPTTRIDAHALLFEGNKALDVDVQSGDMIFVPNAEEVYVMGEVTQPGSVTFYEGLTLLQAISKVGAFRPSAASNRIEIIRQGENRTEQVLRVDAKRIQEGKDPDPVLRAGDMINVPRAIF